MRTLTIALGTAFGTAFVLLFGVQLTEASRGHDREERGASRAVLTGSIACASDGHAAFDIHGGLGVLAIPTPDPRALNVFVEHDEDCLDLLPALAEQVPHRICEISNTFEDPAGVEAFGFVCTGHADRVISAVGKMAKAVIRLQR